MIQSLNPHHQVLLSLCQVRRLVNHFARISEEQTAYLRDRTECKGTLGVYLINTRQIPPIPRRHRKVCPVWSLQGRRMMLWAGFDVKLYHVIYSLEAIDLHKITTHKRTTIVCRQTFSGQGSANVILPCLCKQSSA